MAIPPSESTLAAMPVLPVLPSGAPEKNTDAAGSGRETKPATSGAAAPGVRTAASCDTRLLDSDYPTSARRDELEGRVVVQVRVLQSGRVQEPRVVKGSGFAVLDAAALRASAHWHCTPARQNGEAVESSVAVPVVFRLGD
ncbi:MAG: TonB family protein [Proteobacteria bacterium]|nr:TonB family protein [Pseudomonadota bacterium]